MGKTEKKLKENPGGWFAGIFGYNTLIARAGHQFDLLADGSGELRISMKSDTAVSLIGWIFAHLSFLLPMKRIGQNRFWLAYRHPRPVYRIHYLLVPKGAYANLHELPFDKADFSEAFFALANRVIDEQKLAQQECKLILNAGKFQTFPVAHAHLIVE